MSVAFRTYLPHPVNAAFGGPGVAPRWASGAKDGVGTALGESSKVWFTIAGGILTEVFYPTVDVANSRDLRFYVSDSKTFFDEEGTDTYASMEYIDNRAPAFQITNTAKSGAYRIVKRIFTDPEANSLVMQTSFKPLKGSAKDYRLYLQFAPHIKNRGYENSGRCADYNGQTYLMAWRDDISAALTSDIPFLKMSAGYSGVTDGWHDLRDNYIMDWEFDYAPDGNIALTAEVPAFTDFTLVLSFGRDEVEAVLESAKTLSRSIRTIEREYIREWHRYLHGLDNLSRASLDSGRRYHASAIVLKTHEDKTYKGGVIASLSVPWGEAKGDAESIGYHLVWPRDLVKSAFAFMAMGDAGTAVATLNYLKNTQSEDGSWPQNMWINGTPFWKYIQLDQVALPVLLAWRLKKAGEVGDEYYPMVKKAASYLLKYGPVTEQERWEENRGLSPSTLAAEVAALVCAAHWAEEVDIGDSGYIFSTADSWATRLDELTFSECDCLGEGVPGHYLRIVQPPPEYLPPSEQVCHALVYNRNRPKDQPHHQGELVDAGFLDLVRYGLRDAKDERILSSIRVADRYIRFSYPGGTAFYRFNGDGYGEKEDGSPFDGSGVGRPWPLITGERGVYEAVAGGDADLYIKSLEGFANDGLMFPEQVWDRPDMPLRSLRTGKGTGSATPLVWAHAEYIKLLRTKKDRRGCDVIEEVLKRYVADKTQCRMSEWKKTSLIETARSADIIRIISPEKADLLWTDDGWQTKAENEMPDTGFGVCHFDFKPDSFRPGTTLTFTFRYTETGEWEGKNYGIRVE
ncbi:MAG: glucan 1,4-alpha-glucosidase [Deltaproteobacteria bacterium]|nr:glucan 1,4-alpha-glucosidase [Deltaproteobacteria bacterium]